MSGTATEIDRLKTQVGALDVFVSELQNLEQWNMPSEWRERALRIRNASRGSLTTGRTDPRTS
jgi:nitroimidazol reductase NimA-like FMN-containing flavoprotein (pyridoxamine 5'-phosphate oxidase superfamily)